MSTTKTGRLPGETDDRGIMVRRFAGELELERQAKGGIDNLLAAFRGPDRSRYRAAARTAARNLLSYSGRGYPSAGVEGYGPEIEVAGVEESDYELARRIVDEVDLLSVRRIVDEVLDVYVALDAGDEVLDVTTERGRERVALEVSSRRRARR